MAGVATVLQLSEGQVSGARIALFGVADRAVAVDTGALVGADPDGEEIAASAVAPLDPASDQHASGDYRRHLTAVLVRRSIAQAARRAG